LQLRLDQTLESPYPEAQIQSIGGEIATAQRFSYGTYTFSMRASSTSISPGGAGTCQSGSVSGAFNFYNNSQIEIDVEALGNQPDLVNISSWSNPQPQSTIDPNNPPRETLSVDASNNCGSFHTYAFTWTPTFVAFTIDGNAPATTTGPQAGPFMTFVPTGAADCTAPNAACASIILNHWGNADPSWGGLPIGASFTGPRYVYIAWVKYVPLN